MLAWYMAHTIPQSGKQPRSQSTAKAYINCIATEVSIPYSVPLIFNDLLQPTRHRVGQPSKEISRHCIPCPLNSLTQLWNAQNLYIVVLLDPVFHPGLHVLNGTQIWASGWPS